jgi:hypothetical protein
MGNVPIDGLTTSSCKRPSPPSSSRTTRAAIARPDYVSADRALDEAEKIHGRNPAVVQMRIELLEATAHPARPPNRNERTEGSR